MKNYLVKKDISPVTANPLLLGIKITALAVCWTFFAYEAFKILNCGSSYFMCASFREFSAVFPLYLLFMFFAAHLNISDYLALYVASGILYSLIFTYIINWIERAYSHWRNRPVMKKIKLVPKRGLEPPRDFSHTLLRRVRMPVPPPGHEGIIK